MAASSGRSEGTVVAQVPDMARLSLLLLAALALPALACTAPDQDDTDAQLDEFNRQFGNGKSDGFGIFTDPCSALGPFLDFGDDLTHAGFFMGAGGDGALGVAAVNAGMDVVWDIYHHQLTVSEYSARGVRTPGLGASVEAYAGLGFGFDHGAADWDGYFVTFEAEVGLPFLKDFVALQPAVFVSGIDINSDGVITPNEIHTPPDGVYGFSVGIDVGVSVPTGLPFEGEVTEGLWKPHKAAIRALYDRFRQIKILGVDRLDVRLVEAETGEECDPGWPAVDPEAECVVQFGKEGESSFGSGIDLAYSICNMTDGCIEPLSLSMGLASIGLGAVNDSGLSLQDFCR
jgi:hypothetical protein